MIYNNMHYFRMQFSLKSVKKQATPNSLKANAFASLEETESVSTSSYSSKPIDYLQIRTELEKARAIPVDSSGPELTEQAERTAALRRREEAMGKVSEQPSSRISSTVNLKQSGLVIINEPSAQKAESKHIARMVETAQVNEKFKNLLKMKTAEREKVQAEAEFGARPQEFVTSSYLKQREESLRLERELENRESDLKKRDVSNMFREMLESGNYARSHFVDTNAVKNPQENILDKVVVEVPDFDERLAEKILKTVVPEDAKEVARALEQQARDEALRIVSQLDQLADRTDVVDREETILSAKERYLQRKRQRIHQNSSEET